jgi:hypothetical protein
MSVEFYHLSPVILTDAMFFENVPTCLLTGTNAQRQSAYGIAERQMIQELVTPLLPTQLTGTYMWPFRHSLALEFCHLQSVDRVRGLALDDACSCDLTAYDGCATIRSDTYGYIDPRIVYGALNVCGCGPGQIYQVEVVFTAGLPTGVAANDSSLHLGLATAAAQVLREIVDPGSNEGGPGAPGLKSWSADRYSETRVDPKKTPFGQNAIGTFIVGLVRHLRKDRAMALGR